MSSAAQESGLFQPQAKPPGTNVSSPLVPSRDIALGNTSLSPHRGCSSLDDPEATTPYLEVHMHCVWQPIDSNVGLALAELIQRSDFGTWNIVQTLQRLLWQH